MISSISLLSTASQLSTTRLPIVALFTANLQSCPKECSLSAIAKKWVLVAHNGALAMLS